MTLKEKLESIKGRKVAIWCETQKESEELVDVLNEITDEDYPECFDMYEEICYSLDEYYDSHVWNYGSKDYYIKDGFEIIKFKNIFTFNAVNNIELTQQDVSNILDEKYGEGNWVIK